MCNKANTISATTVGLPEKLLFLAMTAKKET